MRNCKHFVFETLSLIIILPFFLFQFCFPLFAFERVQRNGKRWIRYTTSKTTSDKTDELGALLLQLLKDEGCFTCHSDFYPDLAYDPDDPDSPNCSCFNSLKNGRWFPVDYFSLNYDPARKPGPNPSLSYIKNYTTRKRGHLSHLVYQPFGLGRRCLDCHDKSRYQSNNATQDGHATGGQVFFQDGKTLDTTLVCTRCHGGFYPKNSHAWDLNIGSPMEIDTNSVSILQWGNPATVTCLQCHDDSEENGGIYASYVSRYSTLIEKDYEFYHDWKYEECLITAPDPDTVPGQNYWSVNGHGALFNSSYSGVTLDTGYPNPEKSSKLSPNRGATNNPNIPIADKKHSQSHDLNLDPDDGNKNFCWECHWSNATVKKLMCVESYDYPTGLPIGKYNGHLDTQKYKDERWIEFNKKIIMPHTVWKKCRECHPSKYAHLVCESSISLKYKHEARDSQCIVCHNPHGSGNENGKFNLFMIKGRIFKEKQKCSNCHFSQFTQPSCSPRISSDSLRNPSVDYSKTWTVDFSDPFKQDIREGISPVNSSTIPPNTSDICEVCHQGKEEAKWTKPGIDKNPNIKSERHQNGARHYFDPSKNPNATPGVYLIDYRDTDCTGCHIHDPDPPLPLPPYTPDEQQQLEDTIGLYPFNSKAFAPTCRCHGIGRIDIGTLDYEEYRGQGIKPDIAGKGHGTPPPPFPNAKMRKDPHRAHAVYNFPCRECHIDPEDLLNSSYDPNKEYIFPIDDNTPVGFDPIHNPYGKYDRTTKTCTNLYCHSNGKGMYSSVSWDHTWDESVLLCRDPNNPRCKDENERFNYCNKCHRTPPDTAGTNHSQCTASCDTCHPHNGVYEQKPDFYKHVNGHVDVITMDKIVNTFEPTGCGCCHPDNQTLDFHKLSQLSTLTQQFPAGSCRECHDNEHKKFVICDALQDNQSAVNACCLKCHQTIIGKPLGGVYGANKHWVHSVDKNCTLCHDTVCDIINSNDPNMFENIKITDPNVLDILLKNTNYGHHINYYQKRNIRIHLNYTQDWNEDTGCGVCHQEQYLTTSQEKYRFRRSKTIHENYDKTHPSSQCGDCHPSTIPKWHCDFSDVSEKACTICHTPYKKKSNIHLHLNYTQDWNEDTGCGACHQEQYLNDSKEKDRFRRSKTIHENYEKTHPSSECSDCHLRHRRLIYLSEITCMGCHTADTDKMVGSGYLHNKFALSEDLTCIDCHSSSHEAGEMPYAEGATQDELEGKCKACHTSETLSRITLSCKSGMFNHAARDNCLNCHDVYKEKDNTFGIEKKHYMLSTKIGKMEQSWTNKDHFSDNDCGVCHGEDRKNPLNPSMKIHDAINSSCNMCHEEHCAMNIGSRNCGVCHTNGDIKLPNGRLLHAGIPSWVSCRECHHDHSSSESLHGYLLDSQRCRYCHGDPPSINVICNGVEVYGEHPLELTDCRICHPGVYSSSKHYLNPGPLNIIEKWEKDPNNCGANSCCTCHKNELKDHEDYEKSDSSYKCSECHGRHCNIIKSSEPR